MNFALLDDIKAEYTNPMSKVTASCTKMATRDLSAWKCYEMGKEKMLGFGDSNVRIPMSFLVCLLSGHFRRQAFSWACLKEDLVILFIREEFLTKM